MNLVQSASTGATAGFSNTATKAFPSNNAASNLLVVKGVSNFGYPGPPTDTQGNSYVQAVQYVDGNGWYLRIYYVLSAKAGANSVTVPLPSLNTAGMFAIEEYAPDPNSSFTALDGTASAGSASPGTSASCGPIVTTNAADLLVGLMMAYGTNIDTPGAGFTKTAPMGCLANECALCEYRVLTATGSYSVTATLSSSQNWQIVGVAFKQVTTPPPQSGGGTTPADNLFTLLAKQQKKASGKGTTPSDNIFTLLAKRNLALGSHATPADNIFTLLAKQNRLLGGTGPSPSDTVFTLLAKQNRLLGGSGPVVGDTIFTLLAKNNKLLGV